MQALYREQIVVDPKILVGKRVVERSRISVELVLKRLALDLDLERLLEAYPRLTEEDVKACIAYAHAVVSHEDGSPAEPPVAASGVG